jgi:hypothetical protein
MECVWVAIARSRHAGMQASSSVGLRGISCIDTALSRTGLTILLPAIAALFPQRSTAPQIHSTFTIQHSKFKRSAPPVEVVSNRFKHPVIHRPKQSHFIYGVEVPSVHHPKE